METRLTISRSMVRSRCSHERLCDRFGRLVLANPGSLTYAGREHAYHLFSVDGGEIELQARRFDPDVGEFVAWPEAKGAGRLMGSKSG